MFSLLFSYYIFNAIVNTDVVHVSQQVINQISQFYQVGDFDLSNYENFERSLNRNIAILPEQQQRELILASSQILEQAEQQFIDPIHRWNYLTSCFQRKTVQNIIDQYVKEQQEKWLSINQLKIDLTSQERFDQSLNEITAQLPEYERSRFILASLSLAMRAIEKAKGDKEKEWLFLQEEFTNKNIYQIIEEHETNQLVKKTEEGNIYMATRSF